MNTHQDNLRAMRDLERRVISAVKPKRVRQEKPQAAVRMKQRREWLELVNAVTAAERLSPAPEL